MAQAWKATSNSTAGRPTWRAPASVSGTAMVEAKINWRPKEPYHLFSVTIESAEFVVFGEERFGLRWNPRRGVERWLIPEA